MTTTLPTWKAWLGLVRGPFLLLTPMCLAPGMVAAWVHADVAARQAMGPLAWLVVLAAMCAHISVNALNEWSDFRSGLDQQTVRTPFSGGSGTLLLRGELLPLAWWTGVISLLITSMCGLSLLWHWAEAWLWLAPLGVLGLILVVAYTGWVTRHPWICMVAPGLGFGPLMVAGAQFALLGRYSVDAWVASLLPFFLVNNLLLLNQFPDVEADKAVGRKTLPILLGRTSCVGLVAAQYVAAYVGIAVAVALGVLPWGAMACWLTAPLAVSVTLAARQHADDIPALLPALGRNVLVALLTPLLLALGWWATSI